MIDFYLEMKHKEVIEKEDFSYLIKDFGNLLDVQDVIDEVLRNLDQFIEDEEIRKKLNPYSIDQWLKTTNLMHKLMDINPDTKADDYAIINQDAEPKAAAIDHHSTWKTKNIEKYRKGFKVKNHFKLNVKEPNLHRKMSMSRAHHSPYGQHHSGGKNPLK